MIKFTLDDHEIEAIGWVSPEEHYCLLSLGDEGITRFSHYDQYCGEYSIHWIEVWKGDTLAYRYNAQNVDQIKYSEE